MTAEVNVEKFYERLNKIHAHFVKHNESTWNGAYCISIDKGAADDDNRYLKSTVLHHYLFGYELPDTVLLLTKDGQCIVLAAKRKCEFLEPAVGEAPKSGSVKSLILLTRNKADENAENIEVMLKEARGDSNGKDAKIGVIMKEFKSNDGGKEGSNVAGWEKKLKDSKSKTKIVDVTGGTSVVMAVKDKEELDLLKKSSVLSNKVLKHGFVPRIEDVIDNSTKVTHEKIASEIEEIIENPSKINLNVPKEAVDSCYFPIIQSGGDYDFKVSAQSNEENVKFDVITVSLGARYQMYCSNIVRTFLVDAPKQVNRNYDTLLGMHEACLKAMVPGKPLKHVYAAGVKYLREAGRENLVSSLPKTLGFGVGIDFRDTNLLLNTKNTVPFRAGMVFSLAISFAGLKLSENVRASLNSKSAVKDLSEYGLMIADMVAITDRGADVMTKFGKGVGDISYSINDDDDEEESDDNDRKLAKKIAKEEEAQPTGGRRSGRLAANASSSQETEGVAERERKQIELLARKNEERLRELARSSKKKGGDSKAEKAEELDTYKNTKSLPDNVLPNQVKVDMANQCVILPICGNPVPFHISTIKNVVLPDPDSAAYLRINFYTAGMAVGKDCPENTVKLVKKYAPYATFIREMTFRSLDSHSLTTAFRQISELRKRARTKEIQDQEEANLVKQDKLVRTKNERVPRLADLTMRPVFAGRKTQGNLEAHSNGLRFISTRGEIVDVMYSNIKHAIFQPCESEIMVLVHFHLRNPIMVGKKKQQDIQFFTEVVDASQAVDAGRRSMYDPDEMDDEQRERQLRKRLNEAFKEFCRKVEAVARKTGYSLEFDIPYRDLGFTGNPHKEMVAIQPTLNCLCNLTETPFFVVDLSNVDHVHFERVTFMSKAFDMVLINKDFTKQPWRVDMVPNADKDSIQEWLTDMEISYTEGPMNLNWKQIMATVAGDDRFYMDTEEDEITPKEAGWEFLRMFGKDNDGDEESEEESVYSEHSEQEESSEEESEEEAFASEEDESDYDGDEDLEEQGMDWDDMEREAAADDRRKKRDGDDIGDARPKRKQRRRR
mmetsp:Transcript_43988/g.93660  ORF Transcript_43988/g.93660 Transcript_43988/m.93660 type:complete len:1062 (-) Transcript_43988:138-3323(-)|eukprot:CAMPEP_0172554238 /NCGR_PEP_ID=MMETSP1067-20121228/53736_1 /TAXON_ID=265564 ORGANISM="Thalassiosira punctigera, Strain Tpunct2005C2" /NCGR_SAMPLE_ID=MMETSP1067 /ASSEMBLY_ACC=CAM_ASM_000444 /LENGTH=1061 /DNA_ID=CAMNT_0013342567 /DNA_START=353 /DNA_END=3538 /DNA_ORIENTATION=-